MKEDTLLEVKAISKRVLELYKEEDVALIDSIISTKNLSILFDLAYLLEKDIGKDIGNKNITQETEEKYGSLIEIYTTALQLLPKRMEEIKKIGKNLVLK